MLKFALQNSLQSFKNFTLIWCERLPIYFNERNERQICLLIDFGYKKNYNQGTF